MLNLPDSLYPDPIQGDNSVMSNGGAPANNNGPCDGASKAIDWPSASVEDLVVLLREPEHREKAISSLTQIKKQGRIQDLALHIWRSISTVFLLLSLVINGIIFFIAGSIIYKSLTPEKLTMKDSSKVCDVLVLFECLATHPQTKMQFLNGFSELSESYVTFQIHCYLYPFLETEETSKPFQYLRLMSLGVIGGLLKEVGDPSTKVAVHCLLESGLFPLCLKSIEYGNELSQSTASWIMSRIMMQEQGLQYCCEPANRLCAIMKVFNDVIEKMQDEPSTTVLKNIIQCQGLSPLEKLHSANTDDCPIYEALRARPITLKNLQDLFQKLSMGCGPNAEAVGDVAGSSHLDR
ncbi:cell differentiation protein rcd1-like [Apium graveolens]|uniref:cell differentiation protein rcd1-like n=1 Tax=Apium graveolens TaxID=4045 RepID=UPI003D7A3C94